MPRSARALVPAPGSLGSTSFPCGAEPLITFLDTRGIDEPDYDPREDLAQFNQQAHVVVVTVKALDHAQEHIVQHLKVIRQSRPDRPVVLALTCLHEAYPQEQHPVEQGISRSAGHESLSRSIEEQKRRFEGLVDQVVPIDLTRPEGDSMIQITVGGELKKVLIDVLPAAYGPTLITLDEANRGLQELYGRRAVPHIVGYSMLAARQRSHSDSVPRPLLVFPGFQNAHDLSPGPLLRSALRAPVAS